MHCTDAFHAARFWSSAVTLVVYGAFAIGLVVGHILDKIAQRRAKKNRREA